MFEICVNLHIHTRFSDGSGTHREIALAAIRSGLDAVLVTDHNVYVQEAEGYYEDGGKRVLLLVGEEIHNPMRHPQKSHLLAFGACCELAYLSTDLRKLIDTIHMHAGAAFAAHPSDSESEIVHEEALTWEDWDVAGLDGLEIWNGLSEFKGRLRSVADLFYYALNPKKIAQGPNPADLKTWDDFLIAGRHLSAIGGSDAHALKGKYGPFRRTIFPYEFHFTAINTHLLLSEALNGDIDHDRSLIISAMRDGRAFVSNDSPISGRGFNFTATGIDGLAGMGETISGAFGVTLQMRTPAPAECRLVCNGEVIQSWQSQMLCTYITSKPGVYRVEIYHNLHGKPVGWIFSNPIYIR